MLFTMQRLLAIAPPCAGRLSALIALLDIRFELLPGSMTVPLNAEGPLQKRAFGIR